MNARERLIEAGAKAYAELCDDPVPLPAAAVSHLDAFLAHPDDLIALLVESGALKRGDVGPNLNGGFQWDSHPRGSLLVETRRVREVSQ